MRIIIELDNNYDVNAVSQFLKILSPESVSIQTSPIKRSSIELESFFNFVGNRKIEENIGENTDFKHYQASGKKHEKLLNFVKQHRIKVDRILIPNRDERNAR